MLGATALAFILHGTRQASRALQVLIIGWEGEMVERKMKKMKRSGRHAGGGSRGDGSRPKPKKQAKPTVEGRARVSESRTPRAVASDESAAVAAPAENLVAASGRARTDTVETAPAAMSAAGHRSGRPDGRRPRDLRPVRIFTGYSAHAEGSALIEMGDTRVLCTASVEDGVPRFLRDTGRGWVTAEYGMLPRSTHTRNRREAARGRIGGRTSEIQRLIGRSLRAVTDMEDLGTRTIWIDCDVIQADGGTRTAAITGGFVALTLAVDRLVRSFELRESAIREPVAAVSVGMVGGRLLADLCYAEDSTAEVDMNVVMTGAGRFVEVQGTAERVPFTDGQMARMSKLAAERIKDLCALQRKVLADAGVVLRGKKGR